MSNLTHGFHPQPQEIMPCVDVTKLWTQNRRRENVSSAEGTNPWENEAVAHWAERGYISIYFQFYMFCLIRSFASMCSFSERGALALIELGWCTLCYHKVKISSEVPRTTPNLSDKKHIWKQFLPSLKPLTENWIHQKDFSPVNVWRELGIIYFCSLCLLITLNQDLPNPYGSTAIP